MKKLLKITLFLLAFGLVVTGCSLKTVNHSNEPFLNESSVNLETQSSREQKNKQYVERNGGFFFAKDTDFGTFQNPHNLGEHVKIDYIDPWGNSLEINFSVQEVMYDEEARQWIRDSTFEELLVRDFINDLENYDFIMAKINKEKQKEITYDSTHFGACDENGIVISEFDLLPILPESIGGISEKSPGKFDGWSLILVPKKQTYTLALFVGELLEQPGIVATYYFAME